MMMDPRYGYGYDMMGGYGWVGGLLALFFIALVVIALVLLIIWAVRAASGGHEKPGATPPSSGAAGHDEAVAIAKRRLASGELTRKQYDEIMRTLGG